MLDVESVAGEDRLFQELVEMGVKGVPAPACTSKKAHFFSSCHEKFIVIDRAWTLVQSGNYSNNSIPLNEKDGGDPQRFVKGNRDSGLAVKSKSMARFFAKVLRSDIALSSKPLRVSSLCRLQRPKHCGSKRYRSSSQRDYSRARVSN